MKVRRLLIGSVAVLALGLAAACGGGEQEPDPTPTPTPVVLPEGQVTFEWSAGPPPQNRVDLAVLTQENLQAIREAVERHEQLRHQYECSLTLEGLPIREVATENRIAAIEQYLAKQREAGLCEVITTTYKAYYTVLQADQAHVYAERHVTVRYFDPATGEEVKEPKEGTNPVGWILVPAGDGRWLVDQFGPVRQQQ